MKKSNIYFLLALGLIIFGTNSPKVKGQVVLKKTSEAFEKAKIKAGLDKIGIGKGYEIVVAAECDLVENTAAEVLQKFLGKGGLFVGIVSESKATGKKRLLLGRESNLKTIRDLGDKGEINIRNVSTEDDGFHLKQTGKDIVIAGANPRGVLYGVYALEDFISAGANGNLDIKKIPYYRKRASGPCYSFNRYSDLFTEDFPEEKAVYLSHMGINQLTDQGIGGNLNNLVTSDVFPFQKPPRADYQRKIRAMSALCKKYGIDQYLWLNEPALASIAGNLEKYPKEALGTVRRPWGGSKDGTDRTLCINSPIVRKHLQNMMQKLVREYPDVKGVLFYNMDGGDWICTPELCDRCKTVCKDSPPNEFNPWETQARLITLLAEAAHEEKPDFDFRFWGSVHYHGERFDKMIHSAKGYNSLASSWTASDRTIMVPDAAEPDPAFLISQKICKERAIPLHMICEMNNLEVVPKSLPFPFHVCDALKKFKRWDVKYLTEIFGLAPEHNSINALVMKEFQWNPDQSPKEFLADLSQLQFGKPAGKLMYRAWEEMENAFDVWNDIQSGPFPLAGSQFQLSMGTSIGGLPPAILPDIVKSYNYVNEILTNVEPWLASGYQKYKEKLFQDKMNLMNVHLAQAAKYAKNAIALASNKEFIGICYYEGTNGRPTCKEYAELNYAPIAIMESLCRQRCDMLSAYHLLTEMENSRVAGDQKSAIVKGKLYHELIREDIGVQERFCELLTGFAKMQPCYTRTSLADKEITDHLSVTRAKIEKLKEFIAMNEGKTLDQEKVNRNH